MAASGHCGRVGGSGVNGHPKVLGKIGSCAFFLAAAVLMSSCGFLAGTPAQTVVFPEAQPGSELIRVTAPGWDDQTGFSLMLPPGWQLKEMQGIDSYVGEVVGDGVRLEFDYGMHSWGLNPEDEPEFDFDYLESYEDIGGLRAKLLVSMNPTGGHTGVYFDDLGGQRMNLIGWGLSQEQQRVAIGVFRSIRVVE